MICVAAVWNSPFWSMADNFLNSYYKSQIKRKIVLAEVDENANVCEVETQTECQMNIWE